MSKIHQQHLIERGGARSDGERHERAVGERARKRDVAEPGVHPRVTGRLATIRKRTFAIPRRFEPAARGAAAGAGPGCVRRNGRNALHGGPRQHTATPVYNRAPRSSRRPATGLVSAIFVKRRFVPDGRVMTDRDATTSPPHARGCPGEHMAATLTGLAKKTSDGKLLPMRYINSSSASMHLRCRLMTSRKKA